MIIIAINNNYEYPPLSPTDKCGMASSSSLSMADDLHSRLNTSNSISEDSTVNHTHHHSQLFVDVRENVSFIIFFFQTRRNVYLDLHEFSFF